MHTVLLHGVLMVLSLASNVLVSRALGPEGRGVVSWVYAYSSFAAIYVGLGAGHATKKYLVQLPHSTPALLQLNIVALTLSIMVFVPLFYLAGITQPIAQGHHTTFVMALPLIAILTASNAISDALIGLGKNGRYNIIHALDRCLIISLSLLLVLAGMVSPLMLISVYVFGALCRVLTGAWYLRRHVGAPVSRAELWQTFRQVRRMMFSAHFCNLAMYYTSAVLTLVLGNAVSARELSYFSTAKILVDTGLILPATIAVFALPHLSAERSPAQQRKLHYTIIAFTLATMAAIALPLFFFPTLIISLLFGEAFLPAADCLHIMAGGMIAYGCVTVLQPILASHRHEWLLAIGTAMLAMIITLLIWLHRDDMSAMQAAHIYSFSSLLGMMVLLALAFCVRWTSSPKRTKQQVKLLFNEETMAASDTPN